MGHLFRSFSRRSRRRTSRGLTAARVPEVLERRALLTTQMIGSSLPAIDVAPGQAFEVPVTYRTTNASGGSESLSSDKIDFNLHFDQDQVTFDGIFGLFEEDIIVQPTTTTPESDAAITGDDNDPATETVLRARYVDSGNDGWPNSLPANGFAVYVARFTASQSFSGSRLNFSANESGTGFDFGGSSVELQLQSGPVVSLTNDPIVTEGGMAEFTVELSQAVSESVVVTYSTQDGNGPSGAFAGEDYEAKLNQTITFAPGETQKTISITTLDDSFIENDKFFSLRILQVQGATRGEALAEATIKDDDAGNPTIAIQDAPTVLEGQVAQFRITLSRASNETVTVRYTTTDGNGPEGATNGTDFESATLELLTFQPGETSKTVNVQTLVDAVVEPQEDFQVVLSDSVGAAISRSSGLGRINNNDTDSPSLTIQDASAVTEGGVASFVVQLSEASDSEVTVDFSTVDGNGPLGAMAGTDFTARSNIQLVFPAGTTQQTITISTLNDNVTESTETFTVELSNASGAVISDAEATGTILDDDGTTAAGDVDGNGSFDANDAFLIHLVQLSGTNTSIDQFKGASSLTAAQIRANVDALETSGNVDGAGGFDANDSFLIQLVQLSGTNNSIDSFKGASTLTAAEIRQNVDALGNTGGGSGSGNGFSPAKNAFQYAEPATSSPAVATGDEEVADRLFAAMGGDPSQAEQGEEVAISSGAVTEAGANVSRESTREWMNMLVLR